MALVLLYTRSWVGFSLVEFFINTRIQHHVFHHQVSKPETCNKKYNQIFVLDQTVDEHKMKQNLF